MNPFRRLFSRPRTVETVSRPITLAVWVEALFVADVSENDTLDPTDPAVPAETCRRLCALLYSEFPREATEETIREAAAIAWHRLEKEKAEALAWVQSEQGLLTRLWGSPGPGQQLPIMDYLLSLDEMDGAGGNALSGYAALLEQPLWAAFLFLYARGIVANGHGANQRLRGRIN